MKKIANKLRSKDFGLIIRTVAEGKTEEQITNDYDMLVKHWNKLEKKSKNAPAPTLIYEDLETASSVIRDLLTTDVSKITIDSKRLYKKINNYLDDVSPNLTERLQFYKLRSPLFESMEILGGDMSRRRLHHALDALASIGHALGGKKLKKLEKEYQARYGRA